MTAPRAGRRADLSSPARRSTSPGRSRRAAPGRRSRPASVGSRLTMASRAPLRLASSGKPAAGIDHQRRAQHQEEVAGQRLGLGARHRPLRHGLAEGDGRGLDDAAAVAAGGSSPWSWNGAFRSASSWRRPHVEAGRVAGVAVQLDHLLGGHAGVLVQVVDILGDHRARLARGDQPGDGVVAGVGLRAGPAGARRRRRGSRPRGAASSLATKSWK